MGKKKRRPRDRWLGVTALLCLGLALAVFGFFTIRYGAYTLRDDFNRETLTFQPAMRHGLLALLTGKGEWAWNVDLGTAFVPAFSFYNLGSPFFLLTLLFGNLPFPYYAGLLYAVKFMTAGITSYLYLRCMLGRRGRICCIGAVLYAFSGYACLNLIYQFYDTVALFPLLLLGLEKVLRAEQACQKRRGFLFFAGMVFLNSMTNYFMMVGETVFLVLYFLFRCGEFAEDARTDPSVVRPDFAKEGAAPQDEGRTVHKSFPYNGAGRKKSRWSGVLHLAGRILAAGLLGAGMAGVLLLPNLYYILGNPRSGGSILHWKNLLCSPLQALFLLRSILLPADAMSSGASIYQHEYSSASAWLPMIGISLAVAYVMGKLCPRRQTDDAILTDLAERRKGNKRTIDQAAASGEIQRLSSGRKCTDRLAVFLLVLLALSFSPVGSGVFMLFTAEYKRWWFMLVLMLVLASCRVMAEPAAYPVRAGILLNLVFDVAVILLIALGRNEAGERLILDRPRFIVYCVIALAGLLLTGLVMRRVPEKKQLARDKVAEEPSVLTDKGKGLPEGAAHAAFEPEKQLRAGAGKAALVLVSAFAVGTLFLSNKVYHTEDTRTYLQKYRIGRNLTLADPQYRFKLDLNELMLPGKASGIGAFSSTISNSIREFDLLFDYQGMTTSFDKTQYDLGELLGARYYMKIYDDGSYLVTEGDACPIGFAVDYYVTKHDLRYNVAYENMGTVMMHAAVINDEDEPYVSQYAERILGSETDYGAISEYIAADRTRAVQDFQRSPAGCSFTTTYDKDQLVYLSIPYDKGWHAVVDETELPLTDSAGMMLLMVPKGLHGVTLTYRTPWLRAGACVSVCAWVVFLMLGFGKRKHPS